MQKLLVILLMLVACGGEKKVETASAPVAPPATTPATTTTATATTQSAAEEADEPTAGTWRGQVRIDAHAGTAVLNYVGEESGDFVPIRFRPGSEAGAKILAQCGDDDLCEVEGTVRFLDEPPPENASAVGEIVSVVRVKKLPPDER
ncbi:MAG TPA: hypothetical protein VM733_02015 [Thermoanaerobaculia bacterium]|nr:hypothetical protein [Thermoanaerobaculia bacterium]